MANSRCYRRVWRLTLWRNNGCSSNSRATWCYRSNILSVDTFCGMPEPSEHDSCLEESVDPQERFRLLQTGPDSSDWCRASLDEVRQNLATIQCDFNRFKFVEG